MPEILLAEDERIVRDGLKALLLAEGYGVRTARDGADAVEKFSEKRPDVVVLDVMMPRLNGFQACKEIRKLDALAPIVFLTAKDSDIDQIRGLGLGADDYISKSASEEVFLARLSRIVSRTEEVSSVAQASREFRLGKVKVDFDRRTVSYDGRSETLTASESDLLRLLSSDRGSVFSADAVLSHLRGEGYVGDPATVRVHVMNLRRKLGPAGDMIVNVPGGGYYLIA